MRPSRLLPLICFLFTVSLANVAESQEPLKQKGVWTNPADPTIPASFALQGEYAGKTPEGKSIGAQVIALDETGSLQAVIYLGGLPGAGWDGKQRILLAGQLSKGSTDSDQSKSPVAQLGAATGPRRYMDGNPGKFSATQTFPPAGQTPFSANLMEQTLAIATEAGSEMKLHRVSRESPTLGAAPPKGAVVLFDGTSLDSWDRGRINAETGVLHTDARDLRTKQKFKAYRMHLEFRTPFRPSARGQKRGNSGFYQANGQEIQVLDSFGLEGLKNECGALYGRAAPAVNMCFPPLSWQTYDVELVPNPDKPETGLLTVRHNGIVIHERVPARLREGTFKLQGHGNLLQYRNIWLVERD